MFGFLDGETNRIADRVIERIKTVENRYFALDLNALRAALEADFEEPMRFMDERSTTMRYSDLPEFAFYIIRNSDEPALTAVGFAKFAGFSIQKTRSGWMTSVEDGIAHKATREASKLAASLKRRHGTSSFQDIMSGRF